MMRSFWFTIILLFTVNAPPSFANDVVGKSLLCKNKSAHLDHWIGYVFGSEGKIESWWHKIGVQQKVDLENLLQRSDFDFYISHNSKNIKYKTDDFKIHLINDRFELSSFIDRFTLELYSNGALFGNCVIPLDKEDFRTSMQQISQRHFDRYMKKVNELRELLRKRKI